jgi:probable O-glycosylation ligase (exosortase A-associated)
MRDILVTVIVFGFLPRALVDPFVGIALWTWVSVMNPHRMTWGFAFNFPFAYVIAIATLIGVVVAAKKVKFPWTPVTVTMISFFIWLSVTYVTAIHIDLSTDMWMRITKTLLMTFVAFAVVRSEKQIRTFVWLFVMCVAFFGIKGGIFTLLTGAQSRVYGPPDSQITDNNAISVALVMIIPLVYFLYQESKSRAVRLGLGAAMVLSAVAVLGSYSRGAFVAISAMLLFLAWNSRRRLTFLVLLLLTAPAALLVMPEKWFDRIASIANYAQDDSVLGRFNAWAMAWHLALDRPIFGGGYAIYEPDVFARYAPNPTDIHSAHSIYFQMLGEHGFVGLALFLLLGALTWFTGNQVIRRSRGVPETQWRANLASAIKVSVVGFAVGGLTVNIGYWDVIYFEVVIVVALQQLMREARPAPLMARTASPPGTGVADAWADGEQVSTSAYTVRVPASRP